MKNTNADTAESDQDKNTADVFDNNDVVEKWKRIHSINKIVNQEKMSLILKNNDVKKHWISDSIAWQKKKRKQIFKKL